MKKVFKSNDNEKLYALTFEVLQKEIKNETQPERAMYNFLMQFLASFKRKERKHLPAYLQDVYDSMLEFEKDGIEINFNKSHIKKYTFEYGNLLKGRKDN